MAVDGGSLQPAIIIMDADDLQPYIIFIWSSDFFSHLKWAQRVRFQAEAHWDRASRANAIFFCFEIQMDRKWHQILDTRGKSVIWTNSS